MTLTVGTFNLNNLFSRYNFRAEIDSDPRGRDSADSDGGLTLSFERDTIAVRTFMGRLVKPKSEHDTITIAERILRMDVDVLAVQEVEHIEILRRFNRDYLDSRYAEVVLVEGNDTRLIDVGLLSRLPIGRIISHQAAVHPDDPSRRVFGRDLLQVEILNHDRTPLVTIYNTHMKSHYVPFTEDPVDGARAANERRRRQAETIAAIVARSERRDSRFILTGDMNDPPDSEYLRPMLSPGDLQLTNALAHPVETRPPKKEQPGQGPGPQTKAWTHRFNPSGDPPPEYRLYDQIWLSPALADGLGRATIDRRTKHAGDGSDHDPAWVEVVV